MKTVQIEELSKKYKNKLGTAIVTNYRDAVHWLQNSYVLCNNIPNIDDSIWDKARFSRYEIDDDGNETEDYQEIYQWFISDATGREVEYLEKRFGLKFTYSNLLECYVLAVDHYGTSWDYVYCDDAEKDGFWQDQVRKLKEGSN